ncbi:MAG: hypothetical protein PHX61_05580 [Alphaproteobacteria bacterium]|nr:hypothetical protein [Alphaproteobacteria bacterium]
MNFSPSGIPSMGIASRMAKLRKALRTSGLLAACFALVLTPVLSARATPNYNVVPYYNPICNCCIMVGEVMHQIFWGTGLWTTPDDFQNEFYIRDMFQDRFEPAMQQMTDSFRAIILTNALMIGAFIDGQAELNALASVQKLNAQTIKDYQVSDQICRFGTLSRSLALSDDKSRTVQMGLMSQILNRQLMKDNMNSGDAGEDGTTLGRSADKKGRWKQYKQKFCDPRDSNRSLGSSTAAEKCETTSDTQLNRDIDLTRTLDAPKSLEINFDEASPTLTKDEENIMALGENIYAHDLSLNLGRSDLLRIKQNGSDDQIRKLVDFRSLVAKRSVAANSFAAYAGMKAAGGASSKTYLENVAKELGLSSATDMKALIGDNPSYYTQMDFLAKRLYQTPQFYANLYDSPNNVGRQQAAIKGISLMQDRDIYESLQRSEMLLSTLMEVYVLKQQDSYFAKGMKH